MPRPTSPIRNCTITETLVKWLSAHTSENVFMIEASATMSGIITAGSVPKTNSSTSSAPTAPINASTSTLPPLSPCLEASSSASRPVTLTVRPGADAALAICSAWLVRSQLARPGG